MPDYIKSPTQISHDFQVFRTTFRFSGALSMKYKPVRLKSIWWIREGGSDWYQPSCWIILNLQHKSHDFRLSRALLVHIVKIRQTNIDLTGRGIDWYQSSYWSSHGNFLLSKRLSELACRIQRRSRNDIPKLHKGASTLKKRSALCPIWWQISITRSHTPSRAYQNYT